MKAFEVVDDDEGEVSCYRIPNSLLSGAPSKERLRISVPHSSANGTCRNGLGFIGSGLVSLSDIAIVC